MARTGGDDDPATTTGEQVEFIGVRAHGKTHALVLRDNAGSEYLLPVNDSVIDAVRNPIVTDSRPTDVSEETVIGPREIQALIRSGLSAEEVASEHGLELQKVQRFEMPVLMEREHMADRARTTELRRAHGSRSLGDLVTERLAGRGDDLASLEWDSWKRPDGRWTVQATWLAMGAQIGDDQLASARWVFDPIGRTVVPDDAAARGLIDDSPIGTAAAQARRAKAGGDPYDEDVDDDLTAVVRATKTDEEPAPSPVWTPVVVDGGEADTPGEDFLAEPAATAAVVEEPDLFDVDQTSDDSFDGVDEPATPIEAVTPPQAKPRRKGRASVPSWDEILLGTQGPEGN